jgi:hypothetical protein
MVDDPAAELTLVLLVAPAEVRVQRLAHQLVQRQPVGERLAERQRAQPLIRRTGVAVRKHSAEQLDRRHPRDRRHRDR